jgi:protein-tyrosine phosphatase
MRQKLAQAGLLGTIRVESAGTHVQRTGVRADWRARRCARLHGINIEDVRRRQFTAADFGAFERILVMDRANRDVVVTLAPSPKACNKVCMVLEDSGPDEVPDPAEGTNKDFEAVYRILDMATNRLVAELDAKVS